MAEATFQRFWRRLQQIGLNAYEARSYLVLVGHPRFKALKLAVFDGCQGMIALLDPVVTRPTWTAVIFDHGGLGEAMKGLLEDRWNRAEPL